MTSSEAAAVNRIKYSVYRLPEWKRKNSLTDVIMDVGDVIASEMRSAVAEDRKTRESPARDGSRIASVHGEPISGWFLVKTEAGRWGLTHGDPNDGYVTSMTWGATPEPDPCEGMTDEEIDALGDEAWADVMRHSRLADSFEKEVSGLQPSEAFRLAMDGVRDGFVQTRDGYFGFWLFEKMGKLLR